MSFSRSSSPSPDSVAAAYPSSPPPSAFVTPPPLIERRAGDDLPLATPEAYVTALQNEMNEHPLWRCRLLRACALGHLTLADYRFVFSQYYAYSSRFTRYLGAVMANCENDLLRSRLSQNLWEEGGMLQPEERHAQIFRDFLTHALAVDLDAIAYQPFTQTFAQSYLDYCLTAPPAASSAFLALGTEAIVARLYGVFIEGLTAAGVRPDQLRFFQIHVACDDDHAATLIDMTLSYAHQPGWHTLVNDGMRTALDLRLAFFDELYEALVRQRLQPTFTRIQERKSLLPLAAPAVAGNAGAGLLFRAGAHGVPLYQNRVERLGMDFSVERLPFAPEVLDPRLVRIPPGRCNERHKHAHETLFFIVEGRGRVRVDDRFVPVAPGDCVFVPRWALHQSENLGESDMVILAITDFGLTGKAFVGDYDRTARLKRAPADEGTSRPDEPTLSPSPEEDPASTRGHA